MAQHHHEDLFENRKQFQLERLILFSDAVFAIAITLLVIEIRVPEIDYATNNLLAHLRDELLLRFPQFFGFILSFAVIGQFWTNHHRLFGLVNNFNNGLLWLNLHMLFWIVLVPFTSGLNSHYGGLDLVWQIYSLNLFMIGLSLFFLYRYIGNPKRNLSELAHDRLSRKYSYLRSLSVASIFLLGAIFASFHGHFFHQAARFVYVLIPFVLIIINRAASKHIAK
ncbi:MAG: DUF1211 domain-containing protein [Chitinophagaceae bacterium]|nr:DUF1211 domain-containing protein [Chitinophagaceae bacterium]